MFTVEELKEILHLLEEAQPADNKESATIRWNIRKSIENCLGRMNAV